MRIKTFQIYKYALPFRRPVSVKGKKIRRREGFIVKLVSDRGSAGFGETAPLPGLSHESTGDALIQLKALRILTLNNVFPDNGRSGFKMLESWLKRFKLFPSVRFGIETALLNAYADAEKVPLAEIFGGKSLKIVKVNALLDGTASEVVSEAKLKVKAGWQSLKIKVGRESVIDEVRKIKALQGAAQGRARLRIDINCALSPTQAVLFGLMIGQKAVDYIEEPLNDVSQLPLFIRATGLAVALDEHVSGALKFKGIKALVLKPTLLGGITRTFALIQLARRHRLIPVISSSFESGIGLTTLANLASCAGSAAAGLDTLKFFKADLLKSRLVEKNGTIRIGQFSCRNLKTGMLKKLYG